MKVLFSLFLVILVTISFSQEVNEKLAQRVAENYLNAVNTDNSRTYKLNDASLDLVSVNETAVLYAVNFINGGFVLVSSEFAALPILAYSLDESFDFNNSAPATKEWIEQYAKQFDILRESKIDVPASYQELWNSLITGEYRVQDKSRGVTKLLETRWNQNFPYNYYCPMHQLGPGNRVYAGCVATAMSQIMKYYDYPETGRFSTTYYWGQEIEVDFSEATYHWDSMTNTINSQSLHSIALLMFHCGVAVDMNYGYDGSGAQLEAAHMALKYYFKYRSGNQFVVKDQYSDADWKFLLKEDLDKEHPILYGGTNNNGEGHAFVCDGYQDTSYFHFNWGWGGSANGYYHLGNINPMMSFHWGQAASININPYSADYCNSMYYDQNEWTVSNGSWPNMYWNNTECEWVVMPPDAERLVVSFSRMKTEPDKDLLYVYDGIDENAPLIGVFSGYTLPNDFVANSGTMYLKFITDDDGQDLGWELNYIAENPLNIEAEKSFEVSIFPNPIKNELNIRAHNTIDEIKVFDISGKILKTEYPENKYCTLYFNELEKGIYILKIISEGVINTERIIVQ
jgi:hypothetical protein